MIETSEPMDFNIADPYISMVNWINNRNSGEKGGLYV